MTEENPDKHPDDHAPEGWWEYGVGGLTQYGSGKPVEPHFSFSRLAAEIEAERNENLYVVRRRVLPGTWERVEVDDHPGVDNWTWEQYLEWREKKLRKAAQEVRAQRKIVEEGEVA